MIFGTDRYKSTAAHRVIYDSIAKASSIWPADQFYALVWPPTSSFVSKDACRSSHRRRRRNGDWQIQGTLNFSRRALQADHCRQLAIELALRFNGEIINGDAMQMYKGLPIITNKVSEDEKQNIPHHILDRIGLEEQPWTVSNFRREAHKTIRQIHSRGRLPILVGGTHYYTKAVLFNDYLLGGEDAFSGSEEDSREKFPILEAPTSEILAKLREVDPGIANRWHPLDRRKIQRSLEIWLQTGKTASRTYEEQSQQRLKNAQMRESGAASDSSTTYPSIIFWLLSDKKVLKQRLDDRVDSMLAAGLIQEAQGIAKAERELTTAGIVIDKTKGIWASIGYKEVQPYISAVNASPNTLADLEALKATCIESTKAATRQYARRQDRWIRSHFSDALTESNAMDTLYPLDCTHPDRWETNIHHPAINITQHFLTGTPRPPPVSISDLARATITSITAEMEHEKNSPRQCRYCEVCDKTLMSEKEWTVHLGSHTHRKVLAGRRKWEAFKAWQATAKGEKDKGEEKVKDEDEGSQCPQLN
jgi:tRNA dimethylallyltransferase